MTSRAIRMWAVVSLVTLLLLDLTTSQEVTTSRPQGRGGSPRANRNRTSNNNRTGGGRGRERPETGGSAGQCETVEVPMCKGLVGYAQTKLPNRFNHTTQLQVNRVLEHLWALMDRGCSHNLRLLACSLYLPKCAGGARQTGLEPCAATCTHTKRVCEARLQQFGYTWPQQLDCETLPKKNCLRKVNDHSCSQDYTLCTPINLPICADLGLRYTEGMVPNMFGQCRTAEIAAEMQQFRPLLASGCSTQLGFFLCAVYTPFCTGQEGSAGLMAFPCRELCQEVRAACSAAYARLSGGLPWPNKFQCHRYPEGASGNFNCVMSNAADGLINAQPLSAP